MDKQVRQFLTGIANSVVKLELISYYHEHPFAMDNLGGLCSWLNRREADLVPALEDLAAEGLLACDGQSAAAVYSWCADNPHSAVIERVIEAYQVTRDAVREELLSLERKEQDLRKEYEALLFTERGKTETILNSLDEAVVVLNRAQVVLLANDLLLERLAGKPAGQEVAGTALADILDEETEAVCQRSISEMESGGGPVDFAADGRYYRVQSFPVTGPDGKVITDEEGQVYATVTVFRDVTADREIERMRDDFISMLTHDLKNPLGIILGTSTLLVDSKIGAVNEKQHKLLGNIIKSCSTMDRLIHDFLTLSRLEAGQLSMSLVGLDIAAGLRTIVQMFA
ncbi:MAG: histidine kinase dimerization/phospho-acceptor domain-containing protein, partial [Gemmatimonadota bacterium]|nr:histidine kinase dimerization/phospho-acceptor domain-containing protein [Gemmatimonadota bacterium]